jgi:phospholysine phosphohistidine inorganic pyrophosphate phosphatase
MDGVVYNSDRLIPGAAETVGWMQAKGIPYLFVTNTTSRSRAVLVDKLRGFGIRAVEAEILTPPVAAAEWLRAGARRGVALFVRPSTRREFDGIDCLPEGAESGASSVVIGDLGEHWDYRTLNRAFRLLHANPQAELIALGMTRYWLASDGLALDVAPFVAALEHATGRKALVFGKPARPFFETACRRLGLPAERVLMVGDDIDSDIAGAKAAGLRTALVRTGKFSPADLEAGVEPDAVFDSIRDVPARGFSEASR